MATHQVTISQQGLKNHIASSIASCGSSRAEIEAAADQLAEFCWEIMNANIDDAKKHAELLIFRVTEMRDLQKDYFAGKRGVLEKAKLAEAKVDTAVNKLLSELGYSISDIKSKYEQKKLF